MHNTFTQISRQAIKKSVFLAVFLSISFIVYCQDSDEQKLSPKQIEQNLKNDIKQQNADIKGKVAEIKNQQKKIDTNKKTQAANKGKIGEAKKSLNKCNSDAAKLFNSGKGASKKENVPIGKKEVSDKLIQVYGKDLEYLITSSNLQTITREAPIIGNDADIKKKMDAMKVYFEAKSLLVAKYNEAQINDAVKKLQAIEPQTTSVKSLTGVLEKYKENNDKLTELVKVIIDIDKKYLAIDEDTQIAKQNKLFPEIYRFIGENSFNFVDYPYLSDIMNDIILKKKDVNYEIADFLKKF